MTRNEIDIYKLVIDALVNIFNYQSGSDCPNFVLLVDDLMGPDFYFKYWLYPPRAGFPRDRYPTTEEFEKLKAYAGPHGKTLYKIKQIQDSENDTLFTPSR